MSTELNLVTLTSIAGADLSASQYRFVEQSSAGAVTVCNAAGEKALGVVYNDPANGQAATIAYGGIARVVAGGAITIGNAIATDNQGRAVAATTGQTILGEAMSAASTAGEIVSVLLRPYAASGTVVELNADDRLTETVTISSAELLALHTTPKTLVAAPGEGSALVFEGATLFLDYATTAYAVDAGDDLTIRYTDGSGATVATIETDPFLATEADALRYVYPATTAAIAPVANAALVLSLGGAVVTGDSPLKVQINYRVVPATL